MCNEILKMTMWWILVGLWQLAIQEGCREAHTRYTKLSSKCCHSYQENCEIVGLVALKLSESEHHFESETLMAERAKLKACVFPFHVDLFLAFRFWLSRKSRCLVESSQQVLLVQTHFQLVQPHICSMIDQEGKYRTWTIFKLNPISWWYAIYPFRSHTICRFQWIERWKRYWNGTKAFA